jgi:hypothetical protein
MNRHLPISREEMTGRGADDFGELPGLRREAVDRSAARGHLVTTWYRRGAHDPYGREAFCDHCGLAVIVSTEPALGRPRVYGWTLTKPCITPTTAGAPLPLPSAPKPTPKPTPRVVPTPAPIPVTEKPLSPAQKAWVTRRARMKVA